MLRQLQSDHVVQLVEVFRRKGRLHLVFEWIESSVLELLERSPYGLPEADVRRISFQLLRGLAHIHASRAVHRDVKPENVLVSKHGAAKLCDFGFARMLGPAGTRYTDYVATRWYRAPELLVGDTEYGPAVDVWAAGCLIAEMCNGMPLFPGESDADQLRLIVNSLGHLTPRHDACHRGNPLLNAQLPPTPPPGGPQAVAPRFAHLPYGAWVCGVLDKCLHMDPAMRATVPQLLASHLFSGADGSPGTAQLEREVSDALRLDHDAAAAAMRKYKARKGAPSPAAPPAPPAPTTGGGGALLPRMPSLIAPPDSPAAAGGPSGPTLPSLGPRGGGGTGFALPEVRAGGGGGGGAAALAPIHGLHPPQSRGGGEGGGGGLSATAVPGDDDDLVVGSGGYGMSAASVGASTAWMPAIPSGGGGGAMLPSLRR